MASNRTHAWVVTVQRRGQRWVKSFSDGRYGGKRSALGAAKAYRDRLITRRRPLTRREYASIVRKNNRSGVAGVCRVASLRRLASRGLAERWYWVASWAVAPGRSKSVKFSITKYGEDGAFRRALKARRQALQQLDGDYLPRTRAAGATD